MAAHPVVHIEFPANDPKAASKFYGDLFGWKIQTDPNFADYPMFQAEGGPGGGFVKTGTSEAGSTFSYQAGEPLLYVASEDIDADLRKAESLGGTAVVRKTEIPQVGWFAIFKDPTGNKVGLFTGRQER
jgi:predicted enzyme related to lactoylglutathione lyase